MNKEGWTEGGVLNKDLSIYEDQKEGRRGSEKTTKGKDWFGSLVCVCVYWNNERQVVVVVSWGWDERPEMRDGKHSGKYVVGGREAAEQGTK
jgi:hypothetical protein